MQHQASNIALLQYAVACMGLAGNLYDTTPEPATEKTSVAAAAPAKVVITSA
jgi:hypothetical protein